MKKSRLSTVWILAACMLTACAGGQDITTEKTTQPPEEPVIVLGDENLPEPEIPERSTEEEEAPTPENEPEEAAASEASVSQNAAEEGDFAESPALVIGTAPENTVLESRTSDADGGYTETLLCEDGRVRLVNRRMRDPFAEHTLQEIQQYFTEKEEWQQVTLAAEDDVLSETIGFPVSRFRYVTGEGEESVMHNMIYVACGEYGFILDASAEASDYPDIEERTESWIETVSIFSEE